MDFQGIKVLGISPNLCSKRGPNFVGSVFFVLLNCKKPIPTFNSRMIMNRNQKLAMSKTTIQPAFVLLKEQIHWHQMI